MQATVVSFFPIAIENESKPGCYPGNFTIPASDGIEPQVIHVENSSGYVYLDEYRGSLRTTSPADEMAHSIVEDYCNSIVYATHEARPALFWVEGKHTPAEILKKFSAQCNEALAKQKNYFITLVKIADDDFKRTGQLRVVSDLQRFACNRLNLTREWNVEAAVAASTRCPACTEIISVAAIVCPKCRAILDREKYKKFEFAETR